MIKQMNIVSFTVILSVIFFASCTVGKKMDSVTTALAAIKEQQQQETAQLNKIDSTAEEKLAERKIDKNIAERIKIKLRKQRDYLNLAQMDVAALDSILAKKKIFRQNYKELALPLLDSLKKRGDSFAQRMSLYLMTQDGLNIANYYLFDLGAWFGPGKYVIPDQQFDTVMRSFAPIFDSIKTFSDKYASIPKTGTLIILGFADGTGFTDGEAFTDSLKALINQPLATKEDLNKKLSELRAAELIKHLSVVLLERKQKFENSDSIAFEYIGEGKGEEYPFPHIKNYMVDDERRRIVLCYWSVLPDE